MPSQRKRIGFLPRTEVQNIIDKVCKHNKLSQSKVTGILVEEALSYRGLLNGSIDKLSFDFDCTAVGSSFFTNDKLNVKSDSKDNNIILNKKDEIQMINDFIEFKFFKNIMNKSQKNF